MHADFDRYDVTTCGNSSTNPYCGTPAAWNVIVDKCQSRKTCSTIHDGPTEKLLGIDPCRGVLKYIQVLYQCTGINSVMPNMILVLGPLLHKCFLVKKYLDIAMRLTIVKYEVYYGEAMMVSKRNFS